MKLKEIEWTGVLNHYKGQRKTTIPKKFDDWINISFGDSRDGIFTLRPLYPVEEMEKIRKQKEMEIMQNPVKPRNIYDNIKEEDDE